MSNQGATASQPVNVFNSLDKQESTCQQRWKCTPDDRCAEHRIDVDPQPIGEVMLQLPLGLHDQTDWEGRWHYAEGYAAGWAAAERAIADEIVKATGVQPCDRSAVIRDLIRGVGR